MHASARLEMVRRALRNIAHSLSERDLEEVTHKTDGYSGSDMSGLCREAAMGPCRDDGFEAAMLAGVAATEVRAVQHEPCARWRWTRSRPSATAPSSTTAKKLARSPVGDAVERLMGADATLYECSALVSDRVAAERKSR